MRDHSVKICERHTHVDSQLAEIRVKLTREPQTSCDTRHDDGNKVIEISICWGGELEGPEADFVQSLVIDTERLVRVLNKLVHGEGGIVRLLNEC